MEFPMRNGLLLWIEMVSRLRSKRTDKFVSLAVDRRRCS